MKILICYYRFMRLLREIDVKTPFRTLAYVWIAWYAGFAFVDPHSCYMVVIFPIGAVVQLGEWANPHYAKPR